MIAAFFSFMTESPEELRRVQDFLKKVNFGGLPAAQLIVEASHILSLKLFCSICGALFALLCFGFGVGTWWTHIASVRASLQQHPVIMQPAPKLSVAKCASVQDISRLPEVRARLLGNNIDVLRGDIHGVKFARLFVLESGTLDHSYGVRWTLETWDSASNELVVSVAYLGQELEGHESFSPLKVVRDQRRFLIEVPDVKSSGTIIALLALSGNAEVPDECTHLLKVSNE